MVNRTRLLLLFFLLFGGVSPPASAQTTLSDRSATGALTAAWNGTLPQPANTAVLVSLPSQNGIAVQLTGTFVGTVQFEALIDQPRATWLAILGTPFAGGTQVSSATATGAWLFNSAGVKVFRVRCSTFVSGTIQVGVVSAVAVPPSTATVSGTVTTAGSLTNNNAAPGANNLGVLPGIANAAPPSWTEGDQVLLSENLSGAMRAAAEGPTAAGAAITRPPVVIAGQNSGNVKLFGLDASGFMTVNEGTTGTGGTAAWFVQGQNATGTSLTGNPFTIGSSSVAFGASPAAQAAGQVTPVLVTRTGLPFVLGGHPNIITVRANYTTAQTNAIVVANSAGTKLIVVGFSVTCSNANTVNVAALMGLAQTTTPTTTGVFCAHPGIAPGSGLARGSGGGIIGVGADGDQVIANIGVSTGGSTDVMVEYFTTPS